jgi:hypothetical protein
MSFVDISKYSKAVRYLNLFYVQSVYILLLHKWYMTIYIINRVLHSTIVNSNLSQLFSVNAVLVLGLMHHVGCFVGLCKETCYLHLQVKSEAERMLTLYRHHTI